MKRLFLSILFTLLCLSGAGAQTVVQLADDESIPGLLRSLPDWETVFDKAVLAKKPEPLKAELGNREVIDLIDFTGGTEGVTAPYEEGRLRQMQRLTRSLLPRTTNRPFTGALGTSTYLFLMRLIPNRQTLCSTGSGMTKRCNGSGRIRTSRKRPNDTSRSRPPTFLFRRSRRSFSDLVSRF
jgi:hypothetical protein